MQNHNDNDAGQNRIEVLTTRRAKILGRFWNLVTSPKLFLSMIRSRIGGGEESIRWDERANDLGAYSVIDTRHSPQEFEYVTRRQKEILYPLFGKMLQGSEKTLLDFGCGPGRFTVDLVKLIRGHGVGTDVTAKLIDLAPSHPDVRFIHSRSFFDEYSMRFDVIWICLVLGGIPDDELAKISKNISGALNDDGLLFLVESTSEQPSGKAWRVRSKDNLMALFPDVDLDLVGTYFDAAQEISVLAGRKNRSIRRDGQVLS